MFIALLAPKTHGGVQLPASFSGQYTAGLIAAVADAKRVDDQGFLDAKTAIGLVDDPGLRRTLDFLFDPVIDVLEKDPSWCFTRGKSLSLRRCQEAGFWNGHFQMLYAEYAPIADRFPLAFAQRLNPLSPEAALRGLGQLVEYGPSGPHP